jgi:magnesium-transporting ATPase (P-type)
VLLSLKDINEKYSIQFPKLYTPGQRDQFFNKSVFAESIVEGVITSLILFMFPYAAFTGLTGSNGKDLADHKSFGFTVASILIVVVTVRVSCHAVVSNLRLSVTCSDGSGFHCAAAAVLASCADYFGCCQ